MNKLLIVEDEPLYRNSLYQNIKNEPNLFSIIRTAQNGKEAIEIALELRPQVALIDIEMPVMDGISCAKIIKTHIPDCSIVFLTAYDRFDYAVSGIQLGASNYLLKPSRIETIIAALRDELEKIESNYISEDHINEVNEESLPEEKIHIVKYVEYYIQQHYSEDIHLNTIAAEIGFVPSYLSKLFRAYYGKSFKDYLQDIRMQTALDLLEHSSMNIKSIASYAGYGDPNYFNRLFKQVIGCTPMEYRKSKRKE